MTAPPITPDLWQRIPWHPRARAVAALEATARRLTADVDRLRRQRATLARQVGAEAAEYAEQARRELAALPADPDGPAHLAALTAAMRRAS